MATKPSSPTRLSEELKKYQPLIEGVVELFHPFVEAAVHDLKSGKLVMIFNNLSKRRVGDPTPIQELKVQTENFPDHFSPYYKENWDGKKLKCTSMTIKNSSGATIGLICFNFDTSLFQNLQTQIESFLKVKVEAENPVELFCGDWKKRISNTIEEYLQTEHLSIEHLSRAEKRLLVKHLYEKGIFNFKNAPVFVAEKIGISRASIYNYLE